MRISIITPSLNQGQYIEQTIRSVMDQDHEDVEHIVIDGGSTDGTLAILGRYPHLRWVSENDRGQSDAINKGFAMATGEVVAWLNSDDYYDRNILGDIARYFEAHPACGMLYGDITYVDKNGDVLYVLTGPSITYDALVRTPDIVRQPSCFWRKRAVEETGPLDEELQMVMDFDFLLRITRHNPPHYLPRNLSFFRSYAGGKTLSLPRRQVKELYLVFRKRGVPMTPVRWKYLFGKYLDTLDTAHPVRRIFQPFRKPRQAP